MKRFLAFLLALVLLLSMCMAFTACGNGSAEEEVDPAVELEAETLLGMQPALTAVAIYHEVYGGEYDPKNSSCFWKLIWILTNIYGTNNEEVIFDLEGVIVPTGVVESYAKALFADYDGLLSLPEGTTIRYDEEQDAYVLPWGDTWILNTEYTKVDRDGDDYIVDTDIVDMTDEENPLVLKSMRFVLANNKEAAENADSMFEMSIKSAEVL